MNSVGANIKALRKSRHITQEQLGKAVGVSMQAVSRWECGGAPDISVLPLIADYFDISLDALFGRTLDNEIALERYLYDDLWRTHENQKAERACRYGWAMFKGMSGMESFANEEYGKISAAETIGTYARLSFNNGYVFMNATEEFHYFLVMPEPESGYNAALANIEEYTELFSLLADKHKLRIYVPAKNPCFPFSLPQKHSDSKRMKRLNCLNNSACSHGCSPKA